MVNTTDQQRDTNLADNPDTYTNDCSLCRAGNASFGESHSERYSVLTSELLIVLLSISKGVSGRLPFAWYEGMLATVIVERVCMDRLEIVSLFVV